MGFYCLCQDYKRTPNGAVRVLSRGGPHEAGAQDGPGPGQMLVIEAEPGVGPYPVTESDSWAIDLEPL